MMHRRRRTPHTTSSFTLHTSSIMKKMMSLKSKVVVKVATLIFCLTGEAIRTSTATVLKDKAAAAAESPRAITVIDPHKVGEDVIFHPVPSCLSEVILVVYIQSLELLNRLDVFKDMYGPFVKEVEFYVDGTWCDPRADGNQDWAPCYGPPLDRSIIPEEVHVVDHSGGGWLMQRSLIDAIERPRGGADPAGFLFITDDVLLNLGRLTRAVRASGCEVIWRSASEVCQDVNSKIKHAEIFYGLLSKARQFSLLSDEVFNEQITRNLGSPSTYCLGYQNDFLYIPSGMATEWTKVARQMTELGLVFTFTFSTAIYGIASTEDMVVLRTRYLPRLFRVDTRLAGAKFKGESQPYCWTGRGDVRELLAMHIVHPNKIAFSEKSWDFARTVNPPWTAAGNTSTSSLESSSDGNAAGSTVQAAAASTFWCDK